MFCRNVLLGEIIFNLNNKKSPRCHSSYGKKTFDLNTKTKIKY